MTMNAYEQDILSSLTEIDDEAMGFTFGPEDEDLPYLRCIERRDWEVEKYVTVKVGHYEEDSFGFPNWIPETVELDISSSSNDMSAYFTKTGNKPVLDCQAAMADINRSLELADPNPNGFYYIGTEGAKKRYSNYMEIAVWIHQNRENTDLLRAGWKHFCNERKAAGDQRWRWLTKKQINNLVHQFEMYLPELKQNYETYKLWLDSNRFNADKLLAGWKRFWKRYFDLKKDDALSSWLSPEQISNLTALFKQYNPSLGRKK